MTLIARCIQSVRASASRGSIEHEHIVVLNRCSDRTGEIARSAGCKVITEDARNLSRIRNRGVEASTGDIIVTLNADSIVTENMLSEVVRRLQSGRLIGGGASTRPERWYDVVSQVRPVRRLVLRAKSYARVRHLSPQTGGHRRVLLRRPRRGWNQLATVVVGRPTTSSRHRQPEARATSDA